MSATAAAPATVAIPEVDLKGQYKVYVAEGAGKPLVAKMVLHVAPAEDEVLVKVVA